MQMRKPDFTKHPNDSTRIIDLTCKDFSVYIDAMIAGRINELSKTLSTLPSNMGDLLSRKQTAELLQMTLPTLRKWTKNGAIKSTGIPGSSRVYYKREQVELALKERLGDVRK